MTIERRLPISIRRGEALCLLDDPIGRSVLTDAAESAGAFGRGDLTCDAVASMVTIPGGAFDPTRPSPEFVALCHRALEVHGEMPSRHRVRVLAALSIQLLLGEGEYDEGRQFLEVALTEAEQLGDDAVAVALLSHRYAAAGPGSMITDVSRCVTG